MSMVTDAAQSFKLVSAQCPPARVLAALPGVSKALSGQSPITPAPQPLR